MRPRFLVDVNVGRLAKWLRVMGYDARYVPDAEDGELLRLAHREGRIVVTRDARLLERRAVSRGLVRAVLVHSDDFRLQMRQLTQELGLDFQGGFSMCIECNAPLEPLEREAVRGRVPPYVFQTQESFYRCSRCQKVYWKGTHWNNMLRELAGFRRR